MDDVLREDAQKAASLEEVIEELERLQHSEAHKAKELQLSQQTIQVGSSSSCRCVIYDIQQVPAVVYKLLRLCQYPVQQPPSHVVACCTAYPFTTLKFLFLLLSILGSPLCMALVMYPGSTSEIWYGPPAFVSMQGCGANHCSPT